MFGFDWYAAMGPLTRTLADCKLMQNVMCGPHPLVNSSLRPRYRIPVQHKPIDGLKIAYSLDLGFFEIDEHVRHNTLKTLEVLEGLGAEINEVEFGWTGRTDRVKSIVDSDPWKEYK